MTLKKSILLYLLCFSLFDTAWAFYPTPNQVLRFQPSLLRNSKPFSIKGNLTTDQKKYSTLLSWSAPLKYSLKIDGVAASAYTDSNGPDSWTIIRDSRNCYLKTETKTYICSSPSFWALLEFGGSGERLVRALRASRFILESDMVPGDLDVSNLVATSVKDRRAQLALGQNGPAPIAAIEIKGENFLEENNSGYPLLQFDQKFFAPMLARNLFEGEVITWKSTADLEVTRKKPRFRPVFASRLELFVNNNLLAKFSRQEEGPALSTHYPVTVRESLDIAAFQSTLSDEGKRVLRALFLTH